jgi:RND family efflux transporter MFP subunit
MVTQSPRENPGWRAALLLAAVCCSQALAQGRVIRITTAAAERTAVEDIEWAVGVIESRRSPQIAAQVAGQVVAVYVDEGQGVEAGDLLAKIDNREYRLKTAEDQTEVGRLSALLGKQELELQRARKLFAEKLIAEDQVDSIAADLEALKEQLEGAKARVADSERRLAETALTAPVRSEIAARNIDVGDYVQVGTVAFDLIDVQNLRVRLPFPEYRAPKLETGLAVRLRSVAAGEEAVTTNVTDIRPSVNPANRSITVIVDFENPGRWRPGASVRAEVVLAVREDAVMVPQISIVRRPAGDVVYVIDGQGIAKERPVTRGQRDGSLVEIVDGLQHGERVAVDGAGFLTDGSRVEIVEG